MKHVWERGICIRQGSDIMKREKGSSQRPWNCHDVECEVTVWNFWNWGQCGLDF